MRKIIILLLGLLAAFLSNGQIVNIPDANFKAFLVGNTNVNTNGNSEIEVSEASAYSGQLICSNSGITDLTGIEYFTALTYLNCGGNPLTSLDVSSNTALTVLRCQLNTLTSLDVSANTSLTELWADNNFLTTLDLGANTLLFHLYCNNNSLTALDVSKNTALTILRCQNNSLTTLNISNGNNINLNSSFLRMAGNPDLLCIQVDDPFYMYNNYGSSTHKDIHANYSSNCFYNNNSNTVSGTIFQDQDSNCIGENTMFEDIIIRDTRGYFSTVNSSGNYTLRTDSGTAEVEQIITNPLISQTCFNGGYSIPFDTLGEDTSGFDFFNYVNECPLLTIDISSNRRRRCFNNNTYVHYSNDGFADEDSVEVIVEFPDYIHFVSADYPHTIDADGNYVFEIGNLAKGESGTIHIVDSVACENGITGLTQCTKAWITPINDCFNNLDTAVANWDKSSISVTGSCVGDSIVRFVIYNTGDAGDGDMQGTTEYRIYVDNVLATTNTFQLNGQDSLVIELVANGQTIRLEADQRPGHPGNSRPRETVEGCGNGGLPIDFGLPAQATQDNADYEVAEECLQIIDSYDPNDKNVLPSGILADRFVHPDNILNYTVRFQNTGSDTAYTVIILDTLSSDLDLSTLQLGASSHNYEFDVRGNGNPVLMFTFNDIDLVDSLTDEPNSNGFVSFSIKANEGTVNNTVIHNTADIYFDYNLPITTNDSWITISDTVIGGASITVIENEEEEENGISNLLSKLKVIPNPFTNDFSIVLEDEAANSIITVYDIVGKQVYQTNTGSNKSIHIDGSQFDNGIYILELSTQEGVKTRTRIVKQ